MIFNMHIRNDYDVWYCKDKKRVTTLCGKMTTPKYAGIPGITPNPPSRINDDFGWCLDCCANFLKITFDLVHSFDNDLLVALYNNARAVAGEQLEMLDH